MIPYRLCLGLSLTVAVSAAFAADLAVYKWTDAEGVTHYAEAPPADHGAARVRLDADVAATPDQQHTDYHAILEQANDLQKARLQREQLQAQQREAQRQAEIQDETQQSAAEPEQQPPQAVYVPIYVPRHHGDRDAHSRVGEHAPTPPSRWHRAGRDPAFDPPQQWLRSHPRLLRKELRAQRDSEPDTTTDRAAKRR